MRFYAGLPFLILFEPKICCLLATSTQVKKFIFTNYYKRDINCFAVQSFYSSKYFVFVVV